MRNNQCGENRFYHAADAAEEFKGLRNTLNDLFVRLEAAVEAQ